MRFFSLEYLESLNPVCHVQEVHDVQQSQCPGASGVVLLSESVNIHRGSCFPYLDTRAGGKSTELEEELQSEYLEGSSWTWECLVR